MFLERSRQLPPHAVIGGSHVAVHAKLIAAPPLQYGVAPAHVMSHAPHVAGRERSASQPFVAVASQSSQPLRHASAQDPEAQIGDAFGAGAHA